MSQEQLNNPLHGLTPEIILRATGFAIPTLVVVVTLHLVTSGPAPPHSRAPQ